MAKRIAPGDLTWLLMDRPHNLMHVNGLVGFDELPDFDTYAELILERMVRKYRVLSQIPVERDGHWYWEDDVDFDIGNHVRRVTLPEGGAAAVREYVSQEFSRPFPAGRPLWEMQLLSGPPEEGGGGYMYSRFHHGLGDGIRLVQMLIGGCDPTEGAIPNAVGRNSSGEHHHPLEQVVHVIEQSVTDTLDFVGNAGEAVVNAGRTLVSTTNPMGLAHHVSDAVSLARHPLRLVDALTGIASLENELTNSARELTRMLFSDGHGAGAWSGSPGVEKSVAWIEGFPLDGLRASTKAHGGTLNDVLVAAVSLALTDYLQERGVQDVHELSWMMPVSLRPIDGNLPATLGNHFVVVMLAMPLGIRDPRRLIHEIHSRTSRLKYSAEPLVAFGFQRVIAESPSAIARRVTDFFSGKTIGQLSNVPGPRTQLSMAGAPVRSILGWVPTSGDQPLGVCLFSYDGTVNVGVATDARMIPDPLHLAELIEGHLTALSDSAPATTEDATSS